MFEKCVVVQWKVRNLSKLLRVTGLQLHLNDLAAELGVGMCECRDGIVVRISIA